MNTTPKRIPCCPYCGSTDVTADAAVRWDIENQQWDVSNVFDSDHLCGSCDRMFDDPAWRDATPEETAAEIQDAEPIPNPL